MLIILKTALSYWKEAFIGIIIGALCFITFSWWNQSIEMGRLKTQLNFAAEQNAHLQTKVEAFEKAEEVAKENVTRAGKDRELIVSTLTKEINKLRTQVIPKDCEGAVAYGIKYKDDMKWPQSNN
jgi:hypothetical protein